MQGRGACQGQSGRPLDDGSRRDFACCGAPVRDPRNPCGDADGEIKHIRTCSNKCLALTSSCVRTVTPCGSLRGCVGICLGNRQPWLTNRSPFQQITFEPFGNSVTKASRWGKSRRTGTKGHRPRWCSLGTGKCRGVYVYVVSQELDGLVDPMGGGSCCLEGRQPPPWT